jgi:hypothetical protein
MQATVLQTGVRATMFLDRHHLAVDKKVEGSEERRNHYCCSTHGGLSYLLARSMDTGTRRGICRDYVLANVQTTSFV